MTNFLRTLFALLICFSWTLLSAQPPTRVIVEDGNGDISVAQYDHTTNTISNSFSLNNTVLGGYFFSASTAYDYQLDKLITLGDTSMVVIDVPTGAISANPFPFNSTGGYNAVFRFTEMNNLLCGIIEDGNGNFSQIVYNYVTQTIVKSNSLNGTALAAGGFYAPSATFNDATAAIWVAGDGGMHTVDTYDGFVTTKPYPFDGSQGFNLSMHYDEIRNKVFALYEESNGDVSVATYDFASNTMSGVTDLTGTAVANGFYSEGAGYSSAWRKFIVATDNGIATVDPISGAVTLMAFPFAATNGFEIVFRPVVLMISAEPAAEQPLFSISPNPASELVQLRFDRPVPGLLKLTGLDGRTLQEIAVKGGQITLDVTPLPAGIYLAQFTCKAGTQTRKIVVE